MALDVHSSLAASLFQGDRAASARASLKDKESAALSADKPEAFSSSLDAVAAKSAGGNASGSSRQATKAKAQRAMPGEIAGHQDTQVPTATSVVREPSPRKGADVNVDPSAVKKSGAVAKPTPCGGCETTDADAKAGLDLRATPASTDTPASEETVESKLASEAAAADSSSSDAIDPEAEMAAKLAERDTLVVVPAATPTPAVVGAAVVSGAAPEVAGEMATGAEQVGAIGAAASGTQGILAGGASAMVPSIESEEAKAAKAAATAAASGEAAAELAPDTKTQPGMTQQVAARAQESGEAQAGKAKTSGIEAADPSTLSDAAGKLDGKGAPAHEAPTLRGAVFQQVLEGFSNPGLNRAQTLLSTLDPAVAAQAQNAHTSALERPTPLQLLPVEIGMQAVRGAREFQIRLDPAELGRVDVKLHINEKGEVNATMVVERPETLQLLRRDAQTLAQAFDQAGLKQGENSLSFSLKGDGQQGQQQQGNGRPGYDEVDPALSAQVNEIAMRRVMIPNSSLDLMV